MVGVMAPKIVKEGGIEFWIYPKESGLESPHVHVYMGEQMVRINLRTGDFMDQAPRGKKRAIMKTFRKYQDIILAAWEEFHGAL